MTDARTLTLNLRGRWTGHYGTAPCPVCQPEGRRDQNALTLSDGDNGRLLMHCKKSGCTFSELLVAAGVTNGDYRRTDPAALAEREDERRRQERQRIEQARRCWEETDPIEGTPAEAYLRSRGITCPLPDTLRFHPGCWHGPTAKRFPAMVARVDGAKAFAVHRTYLLPDGSGKADLEDSKMMLGPVQGGAVRLSEGLGYIAVAEGIETALSLRCGLLYEPANVWATLSAGGVTGLHLPRRPGWLIIAPDGDTAGRTAAFNLAERATVLGWKVDLLTPPDGRDWNDVLQMDKVA